MVIEMAKATNAMMSDACKHVKSCADGLMVKRQSILYLAQISNVIIAIAKGE